MYLERLLTLLEGLAASGPKSRMTVSELVAVTGYPKASVYRQVRDLVAVGLLEPSEHGRYAVGARVRQLAGVAPSSDAARDLARPLLKAAAHQHGATFFLSRLSGHAVEIIHAEVPNSGVSFLHPGLGPRPLHACSCAKAIAAFSDSESLLETMKLRLKAFTARTKTDPGDLESEFALIRQTGFAECVEELEDGVCSVAAPVMTSEGEIRFSLGATATTRVFTDAARRDIGAATRDLCIIMGGMIDAAGLAASA